MDRRESDEIEETETCAPEILCESRVSSFDDFDVSAHDPLYQSDNHLQDIRTSENQSKLKTVQPFRQASPCNNCHKNVYKAFGLPCPCTLDPSKRIFNAFFSKNHPNLKIKDFKNAVPALTPNKVVKICSSCRELGHHSKECPKDPNTRTGANPMDELRRISELKSSKINHKLMTNRKYEVDRDSFNDIACLKATVNKNNNIFQ
jgi:hypothetical protein